MEKNLGSKFLNATKWSALSELMAKLVAPISGMVLARLLTPEAFGVVATLNMIIAFAEIFTDAGFQRYLIQHEFADDDELHRSADVAFWSNLAMSVALWAVIVIFCEPLASLVGNPGLGHVLIVACAAIPMNAFSSIQIAVFKRRFDFKTLFWRRLAQVLVPLCVTIPLAFLLRSYWALVIGTLVTSAVNIVLLGVRSSYRVRWFYDWELLKGMLSFCLWSIVDSVLVWATMYVDVFLIGRMLSDYYLGLYKSSITTVSQMTTLITATLLPVLLPTLSRLQDNIPEMRRMLLKIQKYMAVLLLPLGTGIFVFSDLVTAVVLGDQWAEASPFIGLWGLMEVVVVIFCRFCSVVYPAVGKPKIAAVAQFLHLVVLVPAVVVSCGYGFKALYVTRSLVRLELILVNLFFVWYLIKQSPWQMMVNIVPEVVASAAMALVGAVLLRANDGYVVSCVWVAVCVAVYFGVLRMWKDDWGMVIGLKDRLLSMVRKK